MSARPNDDRRVAEMWETLCQIEDRVYSGLYNKQSIMSPENEIDEMARESLAYALQRIGEESSRLTVRARAVSLGIPW